VSESAVDQAVIAALRADSVLMAAAPGGVFRDVAPAGVSEPYGIVTLQSAADAYGIAGCAALERAVYLVKWVQEANASAGVQAAADRAHVVLQGATLTASDRRVLNVQRVERIAYVETVDESERRFQHRGGLYEVESEAVSA